MSVKSSYIAFHEHFNYIVMHFRCVLYMLSCCVLVGLDSAEPMMFLKICTSYAHAFSCIRTFIFLYSYILLCWYFSDCLSLSLSLSFSLHSCVSLLLWHLNANLLRPRTLYLLGHLLPLTLHHLLFGFVMRTLERTSLRIFVDEAFIRNAASFCQNFLTLTYSLSFTIGVGSHFVTSRSLILL